MSVGAMRSDISQILEEGEDRAFNRRKGLFSGSE
jgi:endonuclease YncB( thermonuclease family)